MRRVLILGATGSIGVQALEVVAGSDELEVVGLSASVNWQQLIAQARGLGVTKIALGDESAAAQAADAWPDGQVLAGSEGIIRLITETECDLVLNAIVGSAGLGATIAALGEGIDLALANKESLVIGGELVMQLSEATGAQLLPVDSEHSALHQLLAGEQPGTVDQLVLTASGGPFRGRPASELAGLGPDEALKHPTWTMGGKITIDSATLMNKGLEAIEAHHLFGFDYTQIQVVVHPQSIIHAVVHLNDGASLAHLGLPDMRVPISYALHYPRRADVPIKRLDLADIGSLTFEPPDWETFRCLKLAFDAGVAGGTAPCTLNAANEVAVYAFLEEQIKFGDISSVVAGVLDRLPAEPFFHFNDLVEADLQARDVARALIVEITG